jgi:hypothetical protein
MVVGADFIILKEQLFDMGLQVDPGTTRAKDFEWKPPRFNYPVEFFHFNSYPPGYIPSPQVIGSLAPRPVYLNMA